MHQIGEVADAVGLSLRTIRHYDEMGIVVPSGRSAGGFRLYTDDDVDRLRLVKRMKPLDFSLEEIRDVLGLLDDADGLAGTGEGEAVRERLAMYAALAAERCERLREQLAAASEFTDTLTRTARHLGGAEARRR
ncbi:MAG TPA: MerR family transcriptional regulator [Acidimicrobiales bacterium]